MDKIIASRRVFLDVKTAEPRSRMIMIQGKEFSLHSRELKSLEEYETKKEGEKQSLLL